ncbi:hypothetical protein BABINDRAFT_163413 [Babjeviella inositovora NRRL Y-12698]|uniref:Late endosomal/lysosomal adaptor and MAPK and MTOR activator 5 n=1 Tax=Babjeviella inositovora NRRL Y-12698 TaxID=984486 RepID=A0A1E3QJ23_9ASCO|nr:uncharacterized protein BABINDRAFT_163413 [Babjeviella inositovora NRRL Y-12698]ODQ77706.1 hypothetical protein BABINDRAFT_163413 [Babjeviella inositovora NRRL Y-12698]
MSSLQQLVEEIFPAQTNHDQGTEPIRGAVLIDTSGYSLSHYGVCGNEDAAVLFKLSKDVLSTEGYGVVDYRECKVYIYKNEKDGSLLAVFA